MLHGRTLAYVPELDGLRAVAVGGVILFHFGVPGFSGGYVGVDVFFVLSGYLITTILLRRIESGTFAFRAFYADRFWRLFPALAVTVLATYCVGAILFSPHFFGPLTNSSVAAVASVANIYFWLQSGYFDADAITKPLLHTWSLSVEEQFYLLWPLLVLVIAKLPSGRARVAFVLGASAVSVVTAEVFLGTYPSSVYFLMPFRIFEFGAGALVAVLGAGRWIKPGIACDLVVAASLAALLWSFSWLDEATPFPGLIALIPCVASALLVSAAPLSRLGPVFRCGPMVYVGRLSYSAYLVHWPVVVFCSYVFIDVDLPIVLLMAALTWGLTHLLHTYVETPLRNGRATGWMKERRAWLIGGVVATLLAPVTVATVMGDIPGRYAPALDEQAVQAGMGARFRALEEHCRIDELSARRCYSDGDTVVLVFGNSHEPDALYAVDSLLAGDGSVKLVYFGTENGCGITVADGSISADSTDRSCPERTDVLNDDAFVQRLDAVVYSARYPFSANKQLFLDVFHNLTQRNPDLRFLIFGDYIITKVACAELINRFGNSRACRDPRVVVNPDLTDAGTLRAAFENLDAVIVDKWSLLCPGGRLSSCATETPDGVPMFYDTHHLSPEFARYLGARMREREAYRRQLVGPGS